MLKKNETIQIGDMAFVVKQVYSRGRLMIKYLGLLPAEKPKETTREEAEKNLKEQLSAEPVSEKQLALLFKEAADPEKPNLERMWEVKTEEEENVEANKESTDT